MHFSEEWLTIRLYRFMVGDLNEQEVDELRRLLAKRNTENKTRTALETRVFASFSAPTGDARSYLAELLRNLEKRTAG